jgi:hypothetical protein
MMGTRNGNVVCKNSIITFVDYVWSTYRYLICPGQLLLSSQKRGDRLLVFISVEHKV